MSTIWICCIIFQAMSRFPIISMFGITSTSAYVTTRSPRFLIGSRRFSSGVTGSSCSSIEEVDQQIQALEKKFYELNNHTLINLGSPKQVAKAIQCANTTNSCLQHIAVAPQQQYTSLQRQMADTMLQYKIWKKRKVQLLQGRSIYNDASTVIINNNNNNNNNCSSTGTLIATTISSTDSSTKNGDIIVQDEEVPQKATPAFTQLQINNSSSYLEFVESLFKDPETCQVHEMWKNILLHKVDKPSATNLVLQLNSDVCPIGYHYNSPSNTDNNTNKKTSTPLIDFIRQQKYKYPTSIILTRVGEFYEAIGIDAIMLVQFCGLNPMGGRARAGCPIQNIQQTLDGLTQHGLSIAMYEEATTNTMSTTTNKNKVTNTSASNNNNKLKRRIFAQQVTPANPTYMYDLCLGMDTLDILSSQVESRPHVGIVHTPAGYTVVEIFWEERLVRVSERLPAEAVSCRLSAYPPVEPLFYIPTLSELEKKKTSPSSTASLPFLPSSYDSSNSISFSSSNSNSNNNNNIRIQWLPPFLLSEESPDTSEVERCKNVFVNELLRITTSRYKSEEQEEEESLAAEDFILCYHHPSTSSSSSPSVTTMPLHKETAIQLGLLNNPVIPNLVAYLLPPNSPAATRRFLKRWLLIPRPSHIANSMRRLLQYLMMEHTHPQPPLYVPQVGKLVSLIRAYQASSTVFRELIGTLSTTVTIFDTYDVVDDLLALIEHESGIKAEKYSLLSRCSVALQCIEQVVQPLQNNANIDKCSDYGWLVPKAFFERNEADWRGRIRREVAEQTYSNVERAANKLVETIKRDFWGNPNDREIDLRGTAASTSSSSLIAHDVFNNMLALKSIPRWANNNNEENNSYYHPRDRNGKLLKNRWTTKDVDAALTSYHQACQDACNDVRSTLTQLSETLCHSGLLPTIVQAAYANLIVSTAYHHASHMSKKKWNLANVLETDQTDIKGCSLSFSGLWPYWMDESSSVSNSFELCGLYILTSPNMSGKSTLMRSTAAAALLIACGLCAPLRQGSWVKRFDTLFVRGASADVPSEGKSAFGAEMGDIATLLRSCGEHSLVFVDELARGTSPRDGTSLAGAILEEMAVKGMCGFFATHLHGILSLPLKEEATSRLGRRRMALNETNLGDRTQSYGWTYKLEEGICTDSLALQTAERFGLSTDILSRAETFLDLVSDVEVSRSSQVLQEDIAYPPHFNSSETKEICDGLAAISHFLEGMAKAKVFQIPRQYLPPAQLASSPCVYVLQLEDGDSFRYYVGQTADLSNRINQHRKKGKKWKASDAVAIPIEKGTDDARIIETLAIREISRLGFKLVSWADG